jgi:hypothetical protein
MWLAAGMGDSGSRAEDRFWEQRLAAALDRLLDEGNDEAIENALDQLYEQGARGYDALADVVEGCAETRALERAGKPAEALLIALPLLAWSRFSIPAVTLPDGVLAALETQLRAHVLAAETELALADFLFSPDQMPRGYAATGEIGGRLAASVERGRHLHIAAGELPETARFLSDNRFLLGLVVAPRGAPLFRWQEPDGTRAQSLAAWQAQGGAVLRPVLTGCAFELLLPDAFHSAWRQADRDARVYSTRASVAYLQTTLDLQAQDLRAIVAPFHDRELEEYRIGFTRRNSNEVLHGVTWPLLGAEDERSEIPAEIEATLREAGLAEVVALDQRFPLEFCDDCGAPMFPNPDGEAVHAEMPNEGEAVPAQLH